MRKTVKLVSLKMVREKSKLYEIREICTIKDVISIVKDFIGEVSREYVVVIALSNNNEINAMEVCSIGTSTYGIMSPREVFKLPLLTNSNKIILVHTHPSGNVKPSKEDNLVTMTMIEASEILDIEICDHIIIGDNKYYSFKEHKKL